MTDNNIILVRQTGGAEALEYADADMPKPQAGEVLIRNTAIGINFIDVYFRSGLYPAPLPFTPGMEGAGIVEAIGAGVTDFKPGDRVAYASRPIGAYATYRTMPADRVIKLPDEISNETAAACLLKGMTAEYLLRRTFPVQRGQTILFHAAAGGVGLIAGQWAKHLGAITIGTAGSAEKCARARANGYDHVIHYNTEDFVARVREITNGAGVAVVYDSVGAATFEKSLDCLAPRGMMVSFGNASGPVPMIAPLTLTQKGSIFLTRPSLMDYTRTTEEYRTGAAALFGVIRSGAVKISPPHRYALEDARKAHEDLEGRKTTGAGILIP